MKTAIETYDEELALTHVAQVDEGRWLVFRRPLPASPTGEVVLHCQEFATPQEAERCARERALDAVLKDAQKRRT